MTGKIEGSSEEIGGSVNAFFAQDGIEQLDSPVLERQRLDFVRRNRVYLRPTIINKSGPFSNKEIWFIIEERPFDFLANAHCYKDHPLYDQFLEKAARNSVEETPWEVLKRAYLFDGQPWEEEVVMAATEKCPPVLTKQFADRIKDEELRKKVLARAEELLKKNSKK